MSWALDALFDNREHDVTYMMGRWARRGAAVVLAATIALAGCGGSEDDTAATGATSGAGDGHDHSHGEDEAGDEHAAHGSGGEPAFAPADADTTVEVAMTDFAFSGIPADVKGTKVLFKVANEGPGEHEFVVFKEGGDDPVSGIGPFAKGNTKDLAVELAPGSYTVRCLVKVGDQTHAELGMQTAFTVG